MIGDRHFLSSAQETTGTVINYQSSVQAGEGRIADRETYYAPIVPFETAARLRIVFTDVTSTLNIKSICLGTHN